MISSMPEPGASSAPLDGYSASARASALRAVNGDTPGRTLQWWHAALAYGVVQAVSFAEVGNPVRQQRKYVAQDKPSWSPPPWLFGPAWSVLTAAMLYGDLRMLRDRHDPSRRARLVAHGTAWASYFAFTPAYFRADSPVLGAVVSATMATAATAAVALAARRGDRKTALAWLPVAAWTIYATALSIAVARRNPDRQFGTAAMDDDGDLPSDDELLPAPV